MSQGGGACQTWRHSCNRGLCGRTPNDGLRIPAREGEGACSPVFAERPHLPLRGKLGWMTPRPGQKKTGNRSALSGLLFPSKSPIFFAALSRFAAITHLPAVCRPVASFFEFGASSVCG